MPRRRISKNVHTKPSKGGIQNMTKEYTEKARDDEKDDLMERIIPTFENGLRNKRKSAWSVEALEDAIRGYFKYCADNDVKPSKAGIRLYLGISRSQYYAWQSDPNKYGDISHLISLANDIMEVQYVNRSEKYPTANIFLLKTSHDHIETSKLDVTSSQTHSTSEDVLDAIEKLSKK